MRLFSFFQTKPQPVIDISLESLRMQTATRIVSMINSCVTIEQIHTVGRIIDLFEAKHDDSLPLRKWYLNKSFEIENATV